MFKQMPNTETRISSVSSECQLDMNGELFETSANLLVFRNLTAGRSLR